MSFTADEIHHAASSARRAVIVAGLATVALPLLTFWSVAGLDRPGVGQVLLLSLVLFVVLLVAGIRWIQWFKLVHAEAERLGRTRFTRPWWWLGWVLPGPNFVLPKMMVNDVWWAADPPPVRRPHPAALQVWWALWATSEVMGFYRRGVDGRFESFLGIVGLLALAASTPFAVRTITVLTDHAVRLSDADPAQLPATSP
jgi:hypothetical protein